MGWFLSQAIPPDPVTAGSSDSVVTALIGTLGTVVVALIVFAGQMMSKGRGRTEESQPGPTPHIGERVAVAEARLEDGTRTLDVLDRHVDGLDDRVDRLSWLLDGLIAWRDEHDRTHPPL